MAMAGTYSTIMSLYLRGLLEVKSSQTQLIAIVNQDALDVKILIQPLLEVMAGDEVAIFPT